jgi:glycosyltransferase involved in cell wall biosynthesis
MNPKVSIILPYYEGLRWLPRAVESVLGQTEIAWELIIVDDGSQQSSLPTLGTLCDKRIRLFRIPHSGKGAAVNFGLKKASADLVCFLDQDDIMCSERLALQIRVFRSTALIDGVYSDYERRHDNGEVIDRFMSRQASAAEILRSMARGRSYITMQTLMMRKEAIASVGGFSEDIRFNGLDDLEFFLRLCSKDLKFKYAPGIVQVWSKHECNFSTSVAFQLSRLRLLDLIATMSAVNPVIRTEQKYFRFHAFYMRGLYFLENGQYGDAWPEFRQALASGVLSWNACYLAFKSFLLWAMKSNRKWALKKTRDSLILREGSNGSKESNTGDPS